MLGTCEDIEDSVQETFLRALVERRRTRLMWQRGI